ncbi:pyruvate carboxylase [Ophiocordyceps camponoti-floridani]|uniref:Pyruvate carboxylase n=1 Tax=Ophiocordyceps camponoti-floridani TaxID=2030778 RepID=A0A8H4VFW6_9HYPO|nr:pyruvate carboxylase [Ophiocordyceps camponoti-floridani]
MESLQLSQVLADLSNLGAAEPQAAAAIVNAGIPMRPPMVKTESSNPTSPSATQSSRPQRPSSMQRSWTAEASAPPKFDKLGRRLLVNTSTGSRPGSAANSTPGTPRRGDSDVDDEWERANTLMALYDIRAKIKQQDNSSLMKAREKINALAAMQQAQQAAERNTKTSDELRRNRYSFPRPSP